MILWLIVAAFLGSSAFAADMPTDCTRLWVTARTITITGEVEHVSGQRAPIEKATRTLPKGKKITYAPPEGWRFTWVTLVTKYDTVRRSPGDFEEGRMPACFEVHVEGR